MPAMRPVRLPSGGNKRFATKAVVTALSLGGYTIDRGKGTTMVNLADLARLSGHGAGLDAMSRQYGLDPALTAKAVEAVLPAFTMAFQRLILNPTAFADFTKAIASGSYAPFFDNPSQSHAATSGAAVLEQLFRSPEAAKQVATHAAALTGVGSQVMQQMMPALAATVVGGMFRYATVEGFADVLRQWGDALKAASEKLDPPKPQDPWSAWQAAAGQMMGLRPAAPPPKPVPAEPANVLDAWVAMVGAMTGMSGAASATPVPQAPPAVAPEPAPLEPAQLEDAPEAVDAPKADTAVAGKATAPISGEEPNPFEAMSQMFETGADVHAQNVAAFQSILDNVWGPARKT